MQETRELKNILQNYTHYVDTKQQYDLGKANKEKVILEFEELCKAIFDFVQLLYTDAESSSEKNEIKAVATYIETYF